MDLFRILYMKKTGQILPNASLHEILFARANGTIIKTIDWTSSITVNDAIAGAVVDYKCKITATQSGSGDPSPTNIRPISGFTGSNISVNGSTVAVTWLSDAGTVYGGTLDATTGTLTVTHTSIDMGDMNYSYSSDTLRFTNTTLVGSVKRPASNDDVVPLLCEAYKTDKYNWQEDLTIAFGTSGLLSIRNSDYTSPYQFKQSVRGILLVYPLAEPITYTLTPTEITLAEGANTIYSDTGDSKLTYKAGR